MGRKQSAKFVMCLFVGLLSACSSSKEKSSGTRSDGSTSPTDTTKPSVTISSTEASPTSVNPIPIKITFSESVSGFASSDIALSSGRILNFSGSGANYSFDLHAPAGGTFTVDVAARVAQDGASNQNTAASQFSIAYDPPAYTAFLSGTPADPSNATALSVDVSGTDVVAYKYKVGPAGTTDCSSSSGYSARVSDSPTNTNITTDVSPMSDGSIKICVVGEDSAGNLQSHSSATFYTWVKDTTAPSVSGLANDTVWTTSKTWNWSCNETCAYDFMVDTASTTDPAGVYGSTTSATQNTGEGRYYIHVQAKDQAGNESTVVHVYADIDAVAPSAPASMDDGIYHNSSTQSPTMSWGTSSDLGSGLNHYEYAIGSTAGGTDVLSWTSAASTSAQATSLTLSNNTTYYGSVRAVDNLGNTSLVTQGNGWLVDTTAPGSASSLEDGLGHSSTVETPILSWADATDGESGISAYQLAIGTTSGGTDILSWKSIGNVVSHQETGLTLVLGTTYYASIRAVDRAGNIGASVSSDGWYVCPGGFVPVAADGTYTTSDFCVAKYEMKDDGAGVPVSQPAGTPWVSITRNDSITECQSLGTGFDLMTNAQWQTIARDIENIRFNWSGGAIASGSINRGHSDNAPGNSLAASADTDPCYGTGQTCSDTTWNVQRRTHILSTGDVIWDLAGNVWDWLKDDNSIKYGLNSYMSQVTSTSHTVTGSDGLAAKAKFGPAGDYSTFNSGEYAGLGYGWINSNGGAVCRGSNWAYGTEAGVFAVNLGGGTTLTGISVGFRCAFQP